MKRALVIINHIGSSVEKAIEELETFTALCQSALKADVKLAFNSERAIRKAPVRVPRLSEVLSENTAAYDTVHIVPLHLMNGIDYQEVMRLKVLYGSKVTLGRPILAYEALREALATAVYDIIGTVNCPVIFAAHGTTASEAQEMAAFLNVYAERHANVHLHTLKSSVGDWTRETCAVLFPLFTVNGHHVQKDYAIGAESLYRQLALQVKAVTCYERALLSYPTIQKCLLEHLDFGTCEKEDTYEL